MRKPILHNENQRGQAIVLIAAVMVALIAALGLAIDGGGMFLLYRDVQNATDSAALTAAFALCTGEPIQERVEDNARQNGFANGIRGTVTITYPPTVNSTDYVTVEIEATKPSYFIQIVYPDDLTVRATTTAQCQNPDLNAYLTSAAIVTTMASGCGGGGSSPLDAIGNNATTIEGDIFVNHAGGCSQATVDIMSGSSEFYLDGKLCSIGDIDLNGDPLEYVSGVDPNTGIPILSPSEWEEYCNDVNSLANPSDPLGLSSNPPSCPSIPNRGSINDYSSGDSNNPGIAQPGTYNDLNVSPNRYVEMTSGTYCVSGDMDVKGNLSSLPGGVTIYQDCTACTVKLNASAVVDIVAQGSGDYSGLLFYSKSQVASNGHIFNGASGINMTGTIYTPQAECNISGGNATIFQAQFICLKVAFSGTSEIKIVWQPSTAYVPPPTFGITE